MPAFPNKQAQLSIEDANETRTCKVGARRIGYCAHVASVLWYLGYWPHNHTQTKTPSLGYADTLQDAATV
ncbi:hypothetical protein TNCV_4170571 [Trichonephila clavipes]|nr:hypothetical protein TNCV_4170571 [Trichonephila clavipes]